LLMSPDPKQRWNYRSELQNYGARFLNTLIRALTPLLCRLDLTAMFARGVDSSLISSDPVSNSPAHLRPLYKPGTA
jgi:hypothetical protein